MCPQCGSNEVSIHAYDFSTCPETGYRDAGERFACRACGAKGDVNELLSGGDAQAPRAPTFARRVGLAVMAEAWHRTRYVSPGR